jgi:hypothetical protein
MVSLLITTGVIVALGLGAVNQGTDSTAEGDFSTVSGGRNNSIPHTGDFANIGGGENNTAELNYDTVGGGLDNTANGFPIDGAPGFATVGGGQRNTASGRASTVSGGFDNTTSGDNSTVGGGAENTAEGETNTISGGFLNTTSGFENAVGGGSSNTASGGASTVGGGQSNQASGQVSTISGGVQNIASGIESSIGGGSVNEASGQSSTISGGGGNQASGIGSTVGGGGAFEDVVGVSFLGNVAGGENSTIGGGIGNTASGELGTVPGGASNSAEGDFSLAAGLGAKANHKGTFVWADAQAAIVPPVGPPFPNSEFASTGEHQFLIRASGGVGIGTNRPNQLLVVGDPFASPLPGNRATIGNSGIPGPNGRSGLNLGEDQDQRAFVLWHNDENYLQFGVKNGNIQENDALVIKDRTVGVGTANPSERLHVNGNVLADDFLTASSLRWKTNIQTIEGALEKVQGLRGVSYDWKRPGEHQIGLIAEEVGEVIPEVVVYEENGVDAKAVDYARLVPVLIEAVKEQQQLLNDQDAQIAGQQLEIAALKVKKDTDIATLHEVNHELEARIGVLEESLVVEAKGVQISLLPFSTSVMWMLASGLGLVLLTPGLALGYHRFRRDE